MREYDEMVSRIKRQKTVEEDQILTELMYIRNRISTSSRILTDRDKTAFFFVLIPEEMALIDTQKAAQLFSKFDVPISGYVVNRVLPETLLREGAPVYLRNQIEMQRRHLEDIVQRFGHDVLAYIPELERDVTGLPMIERLAKIMYGA
jgi:arsenite-transporting ATPase